MLLALPPIDTYNNETNCLETEELGSGESVVGGGNSSFDFDETLISSNPDLFSEDLGTTCQPFNNPQRIIGERQFQTILRVDQPDLGGRPSLVMPYTPGLHAANMPGMKTADSPRKYMILPKLSEASMPVQSVEKRKDGRSFFQFISNIFSPNVEAQPTSYVTNFFSEPSISIYEKLSTLVTSRRQPASEDNPIRWEGDASAYQATTVAGGHILEWRVRWRSNGYSLGNVEHTLTLAPRQTKRIATLNWRRREEAARREITEATDVITQESKREREYSDAVQSSLSEWSKGGSKSSATAAAGGLGFAMGPVVMGGGAAHGRASSSSWQSGGRNVAASEQQSLNDAIRQHAESLRRTESTVVTEVTQEEQIEGVSEVIRNVNYCHSLTVIYHEILRHLRVDTGLAGVRECLFVPFAISKFTIKRALRWRDYLRSGLLKGHLRWALSYLDEILTNFRDSSIPEGRRADHPIKYLSGSIYIQIGLERPEDQEEEEANENVWNPYSLLLPFPYRNIISTLLALSKARRDRYFQKEVAPTMAVRWANQLTLKAGGEVIEGVDYTLAGTYHYNKTVRVDFTCTPNSNTLTRVHLEQINVSVSPDVSLPAGSVANVKHATLHYYTEQFNRAVRSDNTTLDLVDITTGEPDPAGAALFFNLTPWENQNLRNVIRKGATELMHHLNEHVVYYHKLIWWNMDRDHIYMLLDGFTVPSSDGRSIASVVEREPLAILGNALVFRVASGVFLGIDNHVSSEMLFKYYFDFEKQNHSEPIRVSLPTEGLYAQAIMDKCEACEEHAGSTDWVLSDKDPELEDLLPAAFEQRRTGTSNLTPTEFQAPIINLQNVPQAPEPSGLGDALTAVTKGDAFRDMAGLAETQGLAKAALSEAVGLASGFGQKAVDFAKAQHGTTTAKQKLSAIKRAKTDKLISDKQAQELTRKSLESMNVDPEKKSLSQEPKVQEMIEKASSIPKNPVEVTRQTKDGSETVKIGTSAQSNGDVLLASVSGGHMRTPKYFVSVSAIKNP